MTIASLDDLKAIERDLEIFKKAYPEAYIAIQVLFKRNRTCGYKAIAKLLLEETTPEKMKE